MNQMMAIESQFC